MTAPAAPLAATITDRGWALYHLAQRDRHGGARLPELARLGDALDHGTPDTIRHRTDELAGAWSDIQWARNA